MGERKGTNKYYPPDFNPRIHKNLNAYHGTHALRERGRKADQGILTIRFEMPFNCWCLTCKNPIGMGVRYNAEKAKVGMYHSTPIYKFTMPCHLCAGTIVMQTDPQNFDYIILEGARRKNQKWDPEENEQIVIADATEKKKLALDAMYHLEHDVKDKSKAQTVHSSIQQLEVDREALKDDFSLNQLARKQFREAKRVAMEKAVRDNTLMTRLSLTGSGIHLLPEEEADRNTAKVLRLTNFRQQQVAAGGTGHHTPNSQLGVDRQTVFRSNSLSGSRAKSPILSPTSSTTATSSSSSSTSGSRVSNSGGSKLTSHTGSAIDYLRQKCIAHVLDKRAQAFQTNSNSGGSIGLQSTGQSNITTGATVAAFASPTATAPNSTDSAATAQLLSNNPSRVRILGINLKRAAGGPLGSESVLKQPVTSLPAADRHCEDTDTALLVGYTDSDEDESEDVPISRS